MPELQKNTDFPISKSLLNLLVREMTGSRIHDIRFEAGVAELMPNIAEAFLFVLIDPKCTTVMSQGIFPAVDMKRDKKIIYTNKPVLTVVSLVKNVLEYTTGPFKTNFT